jgi:mono/diheme cytochrome c family protein
MKRLVLFLAILAGACRGQPSESPPIHLAPDMDWQPKYQGEEASLFFRDGRSMRPILEGTIAHGKLREDEGYFRGKIGTDYLGKIPANLVVDQKLIRRGQERYNIYCSPCHDQTGSGQGMVVKRGYPIATNLTTVQMPDGQIFDTITSGVRKMPSYRKQIPVDDRWAIVAWVRVLQRSQNATLEDVPANMRDRIQPQVNP